MKRALLIALAVLAFVLVPSGGAGLLEGFTETVSPEAEDNATEPSVAVELQSVLISARHMIAMLEAALERARTHEREISEKISRL